MKKIGLLTTLLVAGLLLTGCNKSVNVENEQERIFACGRSASEYFGISDYSISWDEEEEAGASFVLNGRVNIGNGIDEEKITKNVSCVIDMVDKSVTILEIDEPVVEIPDDFDGCNNYFDGCNRCTLQDDGEIICTEEACEEYQEAYCADEPVVGEINPEIDNTGWEWTNTTESNNYYTYRANIVRTGNIYDYRNEEYGFQFTLPESWNGCIVAHRQSVNNQTAKIDYESFQLLCPRKYAGSNEMHSYIPEGYSETANLIVIGPDTDEWTLNSVADQELIENNKYKFGFGITGGSRDIFDGKIILSDLECGKYPNCLCIEKQSYEVGEFWDNIPNPHQDIGCFVVSILKNHIEIFDPAN